MPSVSNIVIKNGANVDKTFVPTRMATNPAGFVFEERSAAVKAGYNTLRVETRFNAQTRATHIDLVLTVPRLAVTAPASGSGIQPNPTTAYAELLRISVVRPEALEQSIADDGYAFLKNLLSNAQATEWIKNGDLPF